MVLRRRGLLIMVVQSASCRTPDFVQGIRSAVLSLPSGPCPSHGRKKGVWEGWSMSSNPPFYQLRVDSSLICIVCRDITKGNENHRPRLGEKSPHFFGFSLSLTWKQTTSVGACRLGITPTTCVDENPCHATPASHLRCICKVDYTKATTLGRLNIIGHEHRLHFSPDMCTWPLITKIKLHCGPAFGVEMAHPFWDIEGLCLGLTIFLATSPQNFDHHVAFGSVRSDGSPLVKLDCVFPVKLRIGEPTALPKLLFASSHGLHVGPSL